MISLLLFVTVPTRLAILWRKRLSSRRDAKRDACVRRIIVFRLDQLGDVVLTTPLFRELKRMYPQARCTVVVQAAFRSLLSPNRNVDEVLSPRDIRKKWLPVRARRLLSALWFYWTALRRSRFDLAIVPRWDVDESLATMLCALTYASKRIGYSEQASAAKRRINRGFDAAFDVIVPAGPLPHEVDRNLAIVEALGGRVESRSPEIYLTDGDRRFADELLTHHDSRSVLVALGIGARAAGRKWPLRNYADCIARLAERRKVQPIIVCSAGEETEASELSRMLPAPPYILSGAPLRVVCAVLQRCAAFIGNDSGVAHLAAAMDCPTAVVSRHPLAGNPDHPNSPARFAPRCVHFRVVQPITVPDTCMAACIATEAHCIRRVTVERVVAAATQMLSIPVHTSPTAAQAPLDGAGTVRDLPAMAVPGHA